MKTTTALTVVLSLTLSALPALAQERAPSRQRMVLAKGPVKPGNPVAFREFVAPAPAPALVPPAPAPAGKRLAPVVNPPALDVPYDEPPTSPKVQTPAPRLVPEPDPAGGGVVEAAPLVLYPHVRIEDRDNIHPRAVRKIVAVKDPRPCGNCGQRFVYIEICVPPFGRFKYEIKRKDHSKIEYDYGDYEVEITSHKGIVYIDYDD